MAYMNENTLPCTPAAMDSKPYAPVNGQTRAPQIRSNTELQDIGDHIQSHLARMQNLNTRLSNILVNLTGGGVDEKGSNPQPESSGQINKMREYLRAGDDLLGNLATKVERLEQI